MPSRPAVPMVATIIDCSRFTSTSTQLSCRTVPRSPQPRSTPPIRTRAILEPDYGLCLDSRWKPPWDHAHLDWPDFDLPADKGAIRESLIDLLDRARSGECVEAGCLGGHGRTGTALACLAVLAGHPDDGAVNWVRANYCSDAVETPEQAAFAATINRG